MASFHEADGSDLRTDIRPAIARRSPSVRPHGIRSRRSDFQITDRRPAVRAIRHINKSLLPRIKAPNGTIPGNGARPANRLDGIGKTNAAAKPNLAAKTGAPRKKGPSGEEVSGSRQQTTGILSWQTDTRSARHCLSTHLHRSFAFHGRSVASYVPGDKRKSRRVLRRLTVLHTGIEPVFVD